MPGDRAADSAAQPVAGGDASGPPTAKRAARPAVVGLVPRRPWQVVPGVRLFSFYTVAVVGIRVLFTLLSRWEAVGRENIPADGPLVVVANHTNFVDPPLIGATLGRKVLLMAKAELFETPIIGWMVRHYDAFPVRRGEPDRVALRTALEALRQGLAVGMFPEGTRAKDGVLQSPHPGAAVIALRGGCTVLPVGIDGSDTIFPSLRRLRRPHVRVVYGRPFDVHLDAGSSDRLREASDEMMRRVAELLPEWRRGRFARKDSQPS